MGRQELQKNSVRSSGFVDITVETVENLCSLDYFHGTMIYFIRIWGRHQVRTRCNAI